MKLVTEYLCNTTRTYTFMFKLDVGLYLNKVHYPSSL